MGFICMKAGCHLGSFGMVTMTKQDLHDQPSVVSSYKSGIAYHYDHYKMSL